MESFVIRPMTWPVLRLFSRNPLMRTSDRIEAAVATLAGLLIVIAAACAGVIGTMIHDTETQNYLQQARTRHALVAKAVDDSKPAASTETTASTVHAHGRSTALITPTCSAGITPSKPVSRWKSGSMEMAIE